MIVSIINFYYKLNAVYQAEILNLIEMQTIPPQVVFSDIFWFGEISVLQVYFLYLTLLIKYFFILSIIKIILM